MCRFLVYKGSDEILLSKLILDPSHSILTQSFDSRLRLDTRRPHNGDGFGIGYYTDPKLGPEPCIFTSTLPAWNCTNLQRIASKTASPLIFAHVRATTEGSLSDDNCHPFAHGSLMWMHNGGLGGWKHIKRRLGDRLADKWYLGVQGGTDSEWAFALFLDTLERSGYNPSSPPEGGFGPGALRKTLLKTIKQINDFIDDIPDSVRKTEEVDTRSLLNFAITDGHSVICSRYVSSCTDEAASLYYSSGTTWDDKMKGNFQMDRRDKGADIVLVASEPLTFERDNWVTVPTNSTLTIHNQTVMVHPIIDKYYNHNPYHSRSSKFVAEKGLISNEKGAATPQHSLIPTPLASPELTHEFKTHLPPSRMQEIVIARGLTPEPHSFNKTHQGDHSPGGSSDSSNTSSSVEELPRPRTNNNTPDLSGRRTNANTPDIPVSLRRERNTPTPEISRRTNIINTSISPRTREGDAFSFQEYPNRAEEEYPLTLRPSQSLSLRPQEMSNRKKKRSLGGRQPQLELQTSLRTPPPRQGREGGANSAAKIAQYFPELAGSR